MHTTKPGLQAIFAAPTSPYTPIGYVNGTPIYPIGGARSSSGISFAVGTDDGPDPDLDDDDDDEADEDDEDDEPEDDPRARRRTTRQAQADPLEDAEEDDDGDGEDDTDWSPPSRDAFQRMEDALKRANATAARHRRAGKTMQKLGIEDLPTWLAEHGIDPDSGALIAGDVVDPDAPDELVDEHGYEIEKPKPSDREIVRKVRAAEQRGEQKARDAMMPILAQLSAESALRAAGFNSSNPKKLDRMLKLIDPRDLDLSFDADGNFEVEGLDEQIAELRDEWPELFESDDAPPARRRAATRQQPARRTGGAREVDGGSRGRQPAAPKGWLETVGAQLPTRGGRR